MTDFREIFARLDALEDLVVRGGLNGLDRMAGIYERAMQQDPAHGDVTFATHSNYAALVVGPGRDTAASVASIVAVVESLNPGASETSTVELDGLGVILTSATDYQRDLETLYAGNKAVLGPTIAGAGDDFTRAAAEGMREALR